MEGVMEGKNNHYKLDETPRETEDGLVFIISFVEPSILCQVVKKK